MSNFVLDRKIITKKVLDIANPDHTEQDLETAMKLWWANIREGGGLGLSKVGVIYFSLAKLEHWDIAISNHLELFKKFKYQLMLSRKMPCPFYLNLKTAPYIRIYDSRMVVLINLYGNLLAYLDTLPQINWAGDRK